MPDVRHGKPQTRCPVPDVRHSVQLAGENGRCVHTADSVTEFCFSFKRSFPVRVDLGRPNVRAVHPTDLAERTHHA